MDLTDLRQEIDKLDDELVRIFGDRKSTRLNSSHWS